MEKIYENGVVFTFDDEDNNVLVRARIPNKAEVIIPDGVTAIGRHAFYRCRNLKGITIPESVSSIGKSAFEQCTALKVLQSRKALYKEGGISFIVDKKKGRLLNIENPDNISVANVPDVVTEIGIAFCGRKELESINLPDSITRIDNYAFNFTNIKSIRLQY